MASVFTMIREGQIPGEIVWENETHFALLSIDAVQPGHTLVVPKLEVDHWLDQSAPESAALWEAVREVGALLQKTYGCERVCQMIVGWEVPHLHVHLVPSDTATGFPMPPTRRATPDDLAREATRIRGGDS